MSPAKQNPFAAVYKQWDWKTPKYAEDFPFDDQPPLDDWTRLARFFSGRAGDVEQARDKLFDGNNIIVRRPWGIGKSAFILTVLERLREDYSADVEIVPVYINDFDGKTCQDLYRHLLLKVAEKLAGKVKGARDIYHRLTGERLSTTRTRGGEAGIDLAVVKTKSGIGMSETRSLEPEAYKHNIDTLLERARQKKLRVFIAVDDLDKSENQAEIAQMLSDAKALLRNSLCQFVLTGRPLVAGYVDFTAQELELYDATFALAPLDEASLKQTARGQLNLIRKTPGEHYHPFAEDTLERIADLSSGIPRHFNKVSRYALEIARRERWDSITVDWFESKCLPEIEKQWSINVPLDIRRLLYFVLAHGAIATTNDDDIASLLDEMNNLTWAREKKSRVLLSDVIPFLNELVRKNLLISQEDEGGSRYLIAPLARRAAETGKS